MNNIWVSGLLLIGLIGCGGNSSSGGKKIDMSEYLPTMTKKEYTEVNKTIDDSRMQSGDFVENIVIEPNLITTKVNGITTTITTIHQDKISIQEFGDKDRTIIMKKEVKKGDKVIEDIHESLLETLKVGSQLVGDKSIKTEESCVYKGKIDEFSKYFYVYENYDEEHDIIRLECTIRKTEITSIKPEFVDEVVYENGTIKFKPNTSYIYLQKGIGIIGDIDDDCVVEKMPEVVIDDTEDPRDCIGEQYRYILYHPNY